MLRDWLAGSTLQEIASRYGITRQAVHNRLRPITTPLERARARRAGVARRLLARREREAARHRALVEAAVAREHYCPVCFAPVLRPARTTCSDPCAEDWAAGRYRLSEEWRLRQRIHQARTILRNPSAYQPVRVAHARRVLSDDPPPPNRTFAVAGSRASEIAARRGRT